MKIRGIKLSFLAGIFFLAAGVVSAAPTLPAINTNNVIVITNSPYNAVGDGVTDNTTAIQNAINAATLGGTTNGLSGGTVEIPAGIFLSGPLAFKSSVNLQLDAGAILRMLPYGTYPGFPYTNSLSPPSDFITGASLHDIEFSGSGAIDGQGAPWWPGYSTNNRPTMIAFSTCSKVLFWNANFSNSPAQNISIKGNNAGNVTFLGITVTAPSSSLPASQASHNTDAIDLSETNGLIQNCTLSVGDDNVAMGSSAGTARDILITNCTFGTGHGVSIGSFTSSGVSNITVINCTFNGTDNPIRMKSDNNLHGSSKGGIVQNLSYLNLSMTNVNNAVIMIYSYYNVSGTPTSITPAIAAGETIDAVGQYTPIWRNITISNVTANVTGSGIAGIIWGRTEMPVTNIVMSRVNITAAKTFDVYNAQQIQFVDSKITTTTGGQKTFTIWNGNVVVSNSVPATNVVTFDGMAGNTNDSFALYNAPASMTSSDAFGASPITLGGSVLTNTGDFVFSSSDVMNFILGTNTSRFVVIGSLTLGGTNNISAGAGFTNGTYTLMTHTSNLSGNFPTLGATPAGYTYSFTNANGNVNLVVTLLAPTNFTATATNLLINLKWNSVYGATNYNLKRGTINTGPYPTLFSGLTATNYADANVTNAVNYFYVVTALGAGGESTNSLQATAVPLPSNQPTNLVAQVSGNQLQLSWPQDHLGWRLQIQTNGLSLGLWTNWATVPNSTNVNSTNIVINPTNGAVFLRLVYP